MKSDSRRFYQLFTRCDHKDAAHRIVMVAKSRHVDARYHYIVTHIEKKQRNGDFLWGMVDGSQRQVEVTGLEGVVIEAIAKEELVGASAKKIMGMLFWQNIVSDDEGLRYLGKFVPNTERFYLRLRIEICAAKHDAVKAVLDATFGWHLLPNLWDLLHTCQRVLVDVDLSDAIDSVISMADMAESIKKRHILQLVNAVSTTANLP